jgi:methionyl-tRNA formyltransferase
MNPLFIGSKELGLAMLRCLQEADESLKWTIIHPNDASDARSALNRFKAHAEANNIDLFVPSSAAEAKRMILDSAPDVVFVSGWYTLLDEQTLAAAEKGFYGLHVSLLPKYRGGSPLVWSIINGDPQVGATVFRFAQGMDDGEILLQVRVPNHPEDNVESILNKIQASLLVELPSKWKAVLDGSPPLSEQNHSDATFCGKRVPEDGRIDWSLPAMKVHDFIRAQTPPYPGAYSSLKGKKIVFLRTAVDERVFFGTPGQVVQCFKDSVVVACGHASAIRVMEIAIDGVPTNAAKAMSSISIRLT